jgi:hypothetical protein
VTVLKSEQRGDISMSGSVSVVRQLLAAGLLDELYPAWMPERPKGADCKSAGSAF